MRHNPNIQRRFRLGLSAGFGVYSVMIVALGVGYITDGKAGAFTPIGLEFTTAFIPIWAWGLLWCAAGMAGIAAAAAQMSERVFRFAATAQIVMALLWAVFYAIAAVQIRPRYWPVSGTYLAFGILLLIITGCIAALRPVPITEDC